MQEAEKKQAEAERERDVAVQLLVTLLGKLEDAEVWKQDVLVLAASKGSTAVVKALLKDNDVDKDGEGSEALEEEGLEGETGLCCCLERPDALHRAAAGGRRGRR